MCADFKGLPNGANFILIDYCIDELLSINKVSSECKCAIIIIGEYMALWDKPNEPNNTMSCLHLCRYRYVAM